MYELRWYQREAVEATWTFLRESSKSPVVVLPTGSGKSLLAAEMCRQAVTMWAGRVVVLAHRKELLEQNAGKIAALLPDMDVGIYSAGLRRRDFEHDVVCAGIQSIYQKAHILGRRDLVIVDEVHLVPSDGDGMYRQFLTELSSYNPHVRMVGLTATPFRTGEGAICAPGNLFQKVCYGAPMAQLIADGYLCPLTNKASETAFDLSGVSIRGGEFVAREMELAFDADSEKVTAAVRELIAKTASRRSVLIFCAGVNHAEHVTAAIEAQTGQACGLVTGQTTDLERSMTLADFAAQRLKYLCNVNVLTTGYDAPCIDAIVVLRATESAGLFAQIVGRGSRLHPGKQDCLILDFGGNLERHGPIDAPTFGQRRGNGNGSSERAGEVPVKACPNCREESVIQARTCGACGFEFPRSTITHGSEADEASNVLVAPETLTVVSAVACRHQKKGVEPGTAPDTMRVIYECVPLGVEIAAGNLSAMTARRVSEWVCFEHEGFARRRAEDWWMAHSALPVPNTIDEALDGFNRGGVLLPRTITVQADGRFERIVSRELVGDKPAGHGDAYEPDGVDEWSQPAMCGADEDMPF